MGEWYEEDPYPLTQQKDPMSGGMWGKLGARTPRDAPQPVDPLNMKMVQALNPVPMAGHALDIASGARATRALAKGRPMDALHPLDPSKENSFGFLGDMVVNPDVARLGVGLGKVGYHAMASVVPSAATARAAVAPIAHSIGSLADRAKSSGRQLLENMGVVKPDPVARYNALTRDWPRPRPLETHTSPPSTGAMPLLEEQLSNERRVAGRDRLYRGPERRAQAQDVATTTPEGPGTAGWNTDGKTYAQPPVEGPRGNVDPQEAMRMLDAHLKSGGSMEQLPPELMAAFGHGAEPARSITGRRSALTELGSMLGESLNGVKDNLRPDVNPANIGKGVADTRHALNGAIFDPPATPNGFVGGLQKKSRMYKEVLSEPTSSGVVYSDWRGVGGRDPSMSPAKKAWRDADRINAIRDYFEAHPDTAGFASQGTYRGPGFQAANKRFVQNPTDFGELVRHERTHGIMQEAIRQGPAQVEKLPPIMRMPSRLQMSSKPFDRGTALWMDEAVAQGAEKRGALNQSINAAKFLFHDSPARQSYSQAAHNISPTASAIFDTLPASYAAAQGSAALSVPALIHALGRGDQNQY